MAASHFLGATGGHLLITCGHMKESFCLIATVICMHEPMSKQSLSSKCVNLISLSVVTDLFIWQTSQPFSSTCTWPVHSGSRLSKNVYSLSGNISTASQGILRKPLGEMRHTVYEHGDTLLPQSMKALGSNLAGAGPFCAEFACSPCVCVGSHWVPCLPSVFLSKDMQVKLIRQS